MSRLPTTFVYHLPSFVRSTTMDKWKDSELEKMKVVTHSVWCPLQPHSPLLLLPCFH